MGSEKRKCNERKVFWRGAQALLLILGIFLLFCGISLIFLVPRIIDRKILEEKNLAKGGDLYRMWKNPDYTLRSDIYIYSVMNPDQILNGSKPEVTTIGPYVYQVQVKKNILGSGNGTVKYQVEHKFIFDKNASCAECMLRRKIWIPNVVYQKFVELATDPAMAVVHTALRSQTPFLEVAVEDILFKGYKDSYLHDVCTLPFVDFICESILEFPEKIGFLMERNGTSKVFEVSSGEFDGGATAGEIIRWNNQDLLPQNWWNSITARQINGTDGGLFRPHTKKTDKIYVFVPDLCRSIHLTFAEEFKYQGIPAYRFIAKEDLLDPSVLSNKGFCHHTGKLFFFSRNESCLPKGLLDLSHCYKGEPPVVFSLPNFLYADEEIKKSVIGLNESSVSHDGIIVELEPRTGTLFRVYRRSQVNIAMWNGSGIISNGTLSRMRNSVVPLLADYHTAEIGDRSLSLLKTRLFFVEQLLMVLCFVSLFVGTFFISGALLAELLIHTKVMKSWIGKKSAEGTAHGAVVQPISIDSRSAAFWPNRPNS